MEHGKYVLSADTNERVAITRSESLNHHGKYTPDKAHDGFYNTKYSPKDGAMSGNFLKLYLAQAYSVDCRESYHVQ